ncbi:MAG TPA: YoaK family protein [Solirubrobacteraceae bacterium]|nr:YoaK family protein [Solirubrobacteraceae bacterium]
MSASGHPDGHSPVGAAGVIADALHTLRPPAGDRHGPLAPALVALTLVTGVVDATSYLKLGHVFVANMTGNVVFLGFAIAGAGGLSIASSLLAIAAFLLGALLGGRIASQHPDHRGRMLGTAVATQAGLLVLALLAALLLATPLSSAGRYALLIPMALAMGVQNAAAQRLAIPELTTTVLTRTLTGLASESRLVHGPGSQLGRRFVAVLTMLLGAIAGALLALKVSIAAPIALAAAIATAVAAAMYFASRSRAAWASA